MYDIEKFFRVFKFLQDNPNIKLSKSSEAESYYDNNLKIFLKTINFNSLNSLTYPKDFNTIQKSLQAREDVSNYLNNIIFPGSYAFVTEDMALFRKLLIDWAATTKTSSDLMIKCADAFTLDDDDIDKALRSFGIDFVNKKSLDIRIQRALFLLALCDLYKIKGSPESIRLALQYANCPNVIIREWWIEKDPNVFNDLRYKGVVVKRGQYFNTSTKQYINYDQDFLDDKFLSSQNFSQRMADVGEPHWYYKNEEILDIENNPETVIKLPSITPYFGIEYYIDFNLFNTFLSIIERIISEQFNAFINGNFDLVNQEIGVDGFNENITQKRLFLQGYDEPLSLLEVYLGFSYCQIRFDEYVQYKHFKNFLISQRVDLSTEEYHYPWAFQELIYWCYKNILAGMKIEGIIPLETIVKLYKPIFSNYYCATNELIRWWINREKESPSEEDHTENNVPSIFFELPFNYFLEKQDTNFDRILYYNGSRTFNFNQGIIDTKGIVSDLKNLTSTETSRLIFDEKYKSYFSSNRKNEYKDLLRKNQQDILNTKYSYISDPSKSYLDDVEHDGSETISEYLGKYPRSFPWNWAIDSIFYYVCNNLNKWIKFPVEFDWSGGPKNPTEGPDETNNTIFENNYVYKYIQNNKWIRYLVETNWDLCDGSLDKDGHFKETSELAKKIVKAKIPVKLAVDYYDNPDYIATIKFSILLDPYFSKDIEIFSLSDLNKFLEENQCTIDRNNGLIYQFFSYFYENNYLYENVYDILNQTNIWIRQIVANEWDISENGNKIYLNGYKTFILDLTKRYNSERILGGNHAIEFDDTKSIEGSFGDKILVCKGSNGYPQIYDYNGIFSYIDVNGDTIYENQWIPSSINDIDIIDLGLNNEFFEWINTYVESEEDFETLSDKFLSGISTYIKTNFPDFEFDIAGIYKDIKNGGVHKDLIEFFKPKRARLLYFAVALNIDDKTNSIILGEEVQRTKILQEIFDYAPRSDSIFIDQNALINNSYHKDDCSKKLLIPERTFTSSLTKASYYIIASESYSGLEKINGFYFDRPDLQISYPYTYNASRIDISIPKYKYYLNDHNICLTRILNDELINGYDREWILAPRKENLHYCDAYFVCFDSDFTSGIWYDCRDKTLPLSEVDIKIYTSSYLESLPEEEALNLLLPEHQQSTVSLEKYEIGKENHWNLVYPRTQPTDFQLINNRWDPAFCKNILNFRKVFSGGILGYPENINDGGRLRIYDGDSTEPGIQSEEKTLWSNYLYSDKQLLIKDAAKPILSRDVVLGTSLYSDSDYNSSSQIPFWWTAAGFDPTRYKSGPIHHAPLYIAIQQIIDDCYPCRPKSDCCDYYDTGCFHDGPTNPKVDYFDGTEWGPGKYADYETRDFSYDVFTKHHKKLNQFITDPSLQSYYEEEWKHVIDLDNPGDTYCSICDDPVFTPDLSFFTVSDKLKENGVYHNKLVAAGFENDYEWINGLWKSFQNQGQEPIELQSIGNLKDDNNNILEYLYGYVKDENYDSSSSSSSSDSYLGSEIVHIFNRTIGYHYWEIRKKNGILFETVLRSKLKKKIHTVEDLIDWKIEDIHVTPGKFLNGNDIDVAEDDWCKATPIEETTEENQIAVLGKLSSSTWIKFNVIDVPEYNQKVGKIGDVEFFDPYLYYCTNTDILNNTYTWKKIVAEKTWADETWINPNDDNNHYGYMFMDNNFDYRGTSTFCYLYAYVDTENYKGWVRHLVESEFNDRTPTITNEFLIDGNTIHRFVFNPLKYNYDLELPSAKFSKFAENSLDYKYVCGVPVPYRETFVCIWSEVKPANEEVMCSCKIEERIFESRWIYIKDNIHGTFIKVYVDDLNDYKQNYWQHYEYLYLHDEINGYLTKRNTPPNCRQDSDKYFYYDTNLVPTIPAGSVQIGSDNYRKIIFNPDHNYIPELNGASVILVNDPGYNFIFHKRISVNLNSPETSQIYYLNLYDTDGDVSTLTYDTAHEFIGEENTSLSTFYCYFKFSINGSYYYIPIYQSEESIDPNSILIGDETYTGTFKSYGYAYAEINGILRFLPLFEKI